MKNMIDSLSLLHLYKCRFKAPVIKCFRKFCDSLSTVVYSCDFFLSDYNNNSWHRPSKNRLYKNTMLYFPQVKRAELFPNHPGVRRQTLLEKIQTINFQFSQLSVRQKSVSGYFTSKVLVTKCKHVHCYVGLKHVILEEKKTDKTLWIFFSVLGFA